MKAGGASRQAVAGSEEVADRLQQAIVARALAPGDRLGTERELALELNVSRPAVREAVRLLARAHLVRAAKGPGGGVFVERTADEGMARTIGNVIAGMLDAGVTSMLELSEARLLLEVPLAGLAAERASAETLAELRRAVEEAGADPGNDAVQRETDVRFHRTIARATSNRIAAALSDWAFDVLQSRLKDAIAPALVEAVAREQHRDILAAIERRDRTLAEQAMRTHLLYLCDLVETVERGAASSGL